MLVDVERARTVKGWLPRRLGKFYNIFQALFISHRNLTSIENVLKQSRSWKVHNDFIS